MKRPVKILSLLVVFCLLMSCMFISASALEKDNTLRFSKDGKFKILVLADIQETNKPQKPSLALAEAAIDSAKPDLVVLLGDNTAGNWAGVNKENTEQAVDNIAKLMDSRNIPFAYVYGNHDHEGLCNKTNGMTEEDAKEFILSCYQKYDTCLAVEGEEMTGVCNYNLPILSSDGTKTAFNLWFMDSNPYATEEEGGGYGYVHPDQTEWYKNTAEKLKAENGGKAVPSIVFQHIIVPEVYEMFDVVDKGTEGSFRGHSAKSDKYYKANPDMVYEGNVNEAPCSPNYNGGQFDSWLEEGDVIGAVFGHDHVNDFAGVYKGIKLIATPGTGYYSYGNNHGVRTITLDESDLTDFTSETFYYDDLVDSKVTNLYIKNHGYFEFKSVFLPCFFGAVGAVAVVAAGTAVIVKAVKKRRKGK